MSLEKIIIQGARQHNLKNVSLEIPRNKLVVITGPSGSGKSSLAFDTIYAEGQRRYVESLSAYARQFLELMEKPDVDYISGLSPAIAIQQKAPSANPRSTVGTVTEIYDYLRLLFARIGIPHCPECGRPIQPQSINQIVQEILRHPLGTKFNVMAPLVRGRKGEYRQLLERLSKEGFARVEVDKKIYGLEEKIPVSKFGKHDIAVIVDRLEVSPEVKSRLTDSLETALKMAGGVIKVVFFNGKNDQKEVFFSEHYACVVCGLSIEEITPRLFSFNAPQGACPECTGLGAKIEVDPELVIPDPNLSVEAGAIVAWSSPVTTRRHRWKQSWSGWYYTMLEEVSRRHHIPLDKPFKTLAAEKKNILLYGDGEFEGVINNLNRRYRETESEFVKEEIYNLYMRSRLCPSCKGARLKKEALAVLINNKNITEVVNYPVDKAFRFFDQLKLSEREKTIAYQVLKEIKSRLSFLVNVGLDYITLERQTGSLAGGEAQRISLATQIGSGLVGVLYVLDEPTIGLHQRDNRRLLDTLLRLRDLGNTLILVEHDEETIRRADWIVDLGPGAGANGGKVVAEGPYSQIEKSKASLTGQYMSGVLKIPIPTERRKPKAGKFLEILGAKQFNLKNIDAKIPLGLFVCVTGVSGSGKSTLIQEILYKALAGQIYHSKDLPGEHRELKGWKNLDKVIVVDQSPIGRTPRSNPVTYTGAFGPIRDLFAKLPAAKIRGYQPGRFSFNVKGGRCESCQGHGMIKIEMQFLPDVYVKCEVCQGARFNEETLKIKYKEKSIAEVLDLSVEEALTFFENIPVIKNSLQTLFDVGLGYLKLGQPATTLSGGEAQRVKLATELSRRSTGKTLYLLDEPTTGLHFCDIHKLLIVLHRLVESGNTVIVIEHNLDVIKTADWVIDLGPEGGAKGGEIVASGSPEAVANNPASYTGQFLKKALSPYPMIKLIS
ncbi:MAG: excinuclease ABC subunit UvrA [Elusimicrobiota bacterium]